MVDNIAVTVGTGTTIDVAGDLVAGVLTQRVKAQWGPDGTVNDTDIASGKPLPVQLRAATGQTLSDTTGVLISTTQMSTLGSAASAASIPVVIASDQGWPVSTTGFMKKEDVASADGDAGIPAMMVRKATAANTSGTDGDYEFLEGSAGALWVANPASTDKTLLAERVINGGSQYETVAASQTNQAMGAIGAAGDYMSHVIVSPGTAGCGVVTVLDNATTIAAFPGGGTTALSNLIPFVIPIGIISTSGAWKITTGANVTAVGVGRFT